MLFGLLLLFRAEWVHDIRCIEDLLAYVKGSDMENLIDPSMSYYAALKIYRKEVFSQYLAGYFLEESLSIDNIFVMIMIFVSFGIDKRYYHRVLFWGILGAIVMRFLFIFLLGAVVGRFSWVLAIFGAILIYSGVKMFVNKGEEKIDTANHPAVKFASRFFPVIEFSDIIFAVDSIPAVFSVTTDPYIVFFSNIFAIMGLRSLFFLLSNVTDKFWLLRYGLGLLLCFIGVKMIGHEFFGLHISTIQSLLAILGILVGSVLLSLIIPHRSRGQVQSE